VADDVDPTHADTLGAAALPGNVCPVFTRRRRASLTGAGLTELAVCQLSASGLYHGMIFAEQSRP
jgi:hypothetical protein